MTEAEALITMLRSAGAQPTTDGTQVGYDRAKVSAVMQLRVNESEEDLIKLLTEERLAGGVKTLMEMEAQGQTETEKYRTWFERWQTLLGIYEGVNA